MRINNLKQNLTIIGLTLSLVFLVISYVSGYALAVTPEFHVTLLGIILLFRKGALQLPFAAINNSRWMKWNRSLLLPGLLTLSDKPTRERLTELSLKKRMPFDRYKKLVREQLLLSEGEWDQLVLQSFDKSYGKFGKLPPVVVSAPVRGLSESDLSRFIRSMVKQNYPNIREVVLVANENPGQKQDDVIALMHRLTGEIAKSSSIKFVIDGTEPGKRLAMNRAFKRAIVIAKEYGGVGVAVNADPDTFVHPDAISNVVRTFFKDPKIGCVTGDVRVANANKSLLTLLTMIRYFLAFLLERASQSCFGQMYCLSGPFMAIRTDLLEDILEEWTNQTFLGQLCTFGDDRHLTTLTILRGLKAVFNPECIAWTEVPENIKTWIKQQIRWARSGWRETWILVSRGLRKLHPFVLFDLAYLTFFPFLVLGGFLAAFARAGEATAVAGPLAGFRILLPYALWILATNLVFHGMYGARNRRDLRFFLAPLYFFLWIFLLDWIKPYALATLKATGWGTK